MTDWTRRPYDSATDEDAVVFLWLKSFAHSRPNVARGAHRDGTDAERRYWREHAPIIETLLKGAETVVLCDPERAVTTAAGPPVIWAYACFTGDVIHYVGVKRMYAAEFGADMVADLLGSRLERPCAYTHDLVEMRAVHDRRTNTERVPCGVRVPASWYEDRWWLARELVGGARAA